MFLAALAGLVATALAEDRSIRRLSRLRAGCAAVSAALVVASPFELASGLALGVACVAFLLSVHAIWLAMHAPPPLRSFLTRLTVGGDDAWSDQFERPFREYARDRRLRR